MSEPDLNLKLGVTLEKRGATEVAAPDLGRSYWVRCVWVNAEKWVGKITGVWVPVLGPQHEDGEIIGFPDVHWHIDWRFASVRLWNQVRSPVTMPLSVRFTTGVVERRRLKCRREEPMYPHLSGAPWGGTLEKKYLHARLKCLRCPHQNLPLDPSSAEQGMVLCKGHGLRWDLQTGRLAPMTREGIEARNRAG